MPKIAENKNENKNTFLICLCPFNNQNKRNANPPNIPAWTNLSKQGIKEKKPISFGKESAGANIQNSINETQRTISTMFNFLFIFKLKKMPKENT